MRRKIVSITLDNFKDVLLPCRQCLYWEAPQKTRPCARRPDAEALKKKWFEAVLSDWGDCGKILYRGSEVLAYAQFAPADRFPQVRYYPAGPANSEAVLISCLYVAPAVRGRGLGKVLLHSIIRELYKRNIKAVEAFASKSRRETPALPLDFYLQNGFYILRDHKNFPLLRLDLRSTAVSWQINVNLQAILDGLKIPVQAPATS